MPTDPTIARILAETPLYTEVSVSKTFDLAEEVSIALERTGHTPEWLAEKAGMTMEELTSLLSGMDPFYDPIARLEAALEKDLLIGATQQNHYFTNDNLLFEESKNTENIYHAYAHKVHEFYAHTHDYASVLIANIDEVFEAVEWKNEISDTDLYKGIYFGHAKSKRNKVSLVEFLH